MMKVGTLKLCCYAWLPALFHCEASVDLPKGKLKHRNKEVACGGKRKEEKKLSTGFQPDHALLVKHMQTRSDFGSQRSEKEAAGRNHQKTKEKDETQVCHAERKQVEFKKEGWRTHKSPLLHQQTCTRRFGC